MAALSAGLLAGANGAGLRLALKRYFATEDYAPRDQENQF